MPDLDLLRDLGDRLVPRQLDSLRETARVRDRRTRTATVAVSAAVLAGVTAFAFLSNRGDDRSAPGPVKPPDSVSTRLVTYADGASVHYGDKVVNAADAVEELDVTDGGVGFRTSDGRIWFTNGSAPVEIGSIGQPPASFAEAQRNYAVAPGWLVSGNTGSLLAWFDFTEPEAPKVVVYDTRTSEVIARTDVMVPSGQVAYPVSIHGEAAFWQIRDQEGNPSEDEPVPDVRLDLTTGVAAEISPKAYLAELRSGNPARTFQVSHSERGFKVSVITEGVGHQFSITGARGRLEPQGAQPIEVHDGLTDQRLGLRTPAGFAPAGDGALWVVQWLADDRVVLWTHPFDLAAVDHLELLECPIPAGTCEIAVTGPASMVVPFYSSAEEPS